MTPSNPIKERFNRLIKRLCTDIYERDYTIAMALLTAIAGESCFLLGLPGVGKSLVARRLKCAFRNATAFEYLMSRFSTPDEIFGPVSISKLKDKDTYERRTKGYLPEADIVFLDEIWKAGPSIQNALLTVLNEKCYRNGEHELRLPLKGIIAASNELPAVGEGLEALWDRFVVRLVVPPLQKREAFRAMICGQTSLSTAIDESLQISAEEYAAWSEQIEQVEVGETTLDIIEDIRNELASTHTAEGEEPSFISDRRWKKLVRLCRAAAFAEGRTEVTPIDCMLLSTGLWNSDEERIERTERVERVVINHLFRPITTQFEELKSQHSTLVAKIEAAARQQHITISKYRLVDNHYNIVGFNDGQTLISKELFEGLSQRIATQFCITPIDGQAEQLMLVRETAKARPRRIALIRTPDGVRIDGIDYPLERSADNELKRHFPQEYGQLEALERGFDGLQEELLEMNRRLLSERHHSPFLSEEQVRKLRLEVNRIKLQIKKFKSLFYIIQ